MSRFDWANLKLTRQQLGRYAEYFVKMEMVMYGLDVYTAEVDQLGIDFVVRAKNGVHYDVQVKSVYQAGQIYLAKQTFNPNDPKMLLVVAVFEELKPPSLYLLRASEWLNLRGCFTSHDKETYQEWGLSLSNKHMPFLQDHAFDKVGPLIFGTHPGEA